MLTVLATVGGACPTGRPRPWTATEALDAMGETACARAHECRDASTLPPPVFGALFGANAEQCASRVAQDANRARYRSSVEAGRLVYDPAAAAQCVDAMEAATCSQFWSDTRWSAPCEQVFVGTVALGGACTLDDDCADPEASCDPDHGTCEASP